MADMTFLSENFVVIAQLLRWSVYITPKKDVSQSSWLDIPSIHPCHYDRQQEALFWHTY